MALPVVIDGWLQVDGRPLARMHVLQPGVGSGTAWATMLTVLGEAAGAVARQAVLGEAHAYLAEVEAEDNGLTHTTDAIAALLKVRLGSGVHERSISEHDSERCASEILAAGRAGRVPGMGRRWGVERARSRRWGLSGCSMSCRRTSARGGLVGGGVARGRGAAGAVDGGPVDR